MTSNNNLDNYERINSLHPYIKLCDSTEDLFLYCYSNLTDEDKKNQVYMDNKDFIHNTRGVVYDKNNNLVFKSFDKPNELSIDDENSLDDLVDYINRDKGGLDNCNIYDSHEGALIRLFCYKDKWYICTHRKLNAFKSKWSSPVSYGTSFKQALVYQSENNEVLKNMLNVFDNEYTLDRFYRILDKTKQYVFLVKNTNLNRIVCDCPENPMMYHVGTFKDGQLLDDNEENNIGVYKLKKHNFKNLEDIKQYVKNVDYKKITGVIVFLPGNIQVKIYNEKYINMYNVRGNEPSIKFRYLQVRHNNQLLLQLKNLYPDYVEDFEDYELCLKELCKMIHNYYMRRFVHKEQLTVPSIQYKIMRIAHNWYHENKKDRKVTPQVIFEIINTQHASVLNQLIKLYKNPHPEKY